MNTKQSGETYISHPIVAVKLAIDRWLKTNVSVSIALMATMLAAVVLLLIASASALYASFANGSFVFNPSAFASVGLVAFLVIFAVIMPVTIALDYAFIRSQNGEKVGYKTAVKRGYKRLLTAIGTYILAFFAIVLGLLLFIIPGVYIAVRLSYLNSVVANEGLGPVANIKRAFALSKDNLWDIIGVFSASTLVSSLFAIVSAGIVAATPENVFSSALVLLVSLLSAAASILLVQAVYFRYHQSALEKDSQLSKEGTDKMNYYLFIGALVAAGISNGVTQAQSPETNDFKNFEDFNLDDYSGSV